MTDGADVIFMGMGEHDGENVFGALFEKTDIRHDDIDAGRIGLAAEQHPAIDHDPFALVRRPEAIGVEIHTDLARAAERKQDQFVAMCG